MSKQIQKISKVCASVLKITDEDFNEAQKMAEEQINYLHPLKIATQRKYNKMGRNNLKAIILLKDLKRTIEDNKPDMD